MEEIEKQIISLLSCDAGSHPGEFPPEKESESMREFRASEGPLVAASDLLVETSDPLVESSEDV